MLEPTIRKVREGSLMYVDLFRTYYGQASYGFKHKHPDQG